MRRRSPKHLIHIAAASAFVFATVLPAASAEGPGEDAFESEEVTLRLVTEAPGADGTLRAALFVDLSSGWKTYWVDPGEAGVAPSIDLDASVNVVTATLDLGFPTPHRFGDQYGTSNGYSESMAIAITLRQAKPDAASEIRASVLLGVCQTICIPVRATLVASPAPAGDERVAAAFAALPSPATDADMITGAILSDDGKQIEVTARTSVTDEGQAGDLFLAGPKGWSFGKPSTVERRKSDLRFTVPVLSRPRRAATQAALLEGVLTIGGTAVETHAVVLVRPAG
ncbi:MAG: hypothetical protein H7Y08_01160 [Rhizobiaceae bacterium]|nr:hypothetical protein [Rhizobiaceae bacterium]